MTTGREARPIARWLIAASVAAALLAQMAIPALHALEIEGVTGRTAPTWRVSTSRAPVVLTASQASRAHDSATCPVCRILTRTNPVANGCVARGQPTGQCAPAPPATPLRARSDRAQRAHPPRAPPADAVHLA